MTRITIISFMVLYLVTKLQAHCASQYHKETIYIHNKYREQVLCNTNSNTQTFNSEKKLKSNSFSCPSLSVYSIQLTLLKAYRQTGISYCYKKATRKRCFKFSFKR